MLTQKIKNLADYKSKGTAYDSKTLTTLDKVYREYESTVESHIQFPLCKEHIIKMFDDPKIVEDAYQEMQKLHHDNRDEIKKALSQMNTKLKQQLIAECYKSNNIYPELVRVFIKPDAASILNEFIQQNTELKQGLEALKKLPFIKELQGQFENHSPTNKELSDAFNKALKIQDITTKDHICHFFHVCFKWIYEKLIGQYKSKSTLEEKIEHGNAHDTFKSFYTAQ